jgi:hypothetical protein
VPVADIPSAAPTMRRTAQRPYVSWASRARAKAQCGPEGPNEQCAGAATTVAGALDKKAARGWVSLLSHRPSQFVAWRSPRSPADRRSLLVETIPHRRQVWHELDVAGPKRGVGVKELHG